MSQNLLQSTAQISRQMVIASDTETEKGMRTEKERNCFLRHDQKKLYWSMDQASIQHPIGLSQDKSLEVEGGGEQHCVGIIQEPGKVHEVAMLLLTHVMVYSSGPVAHVCETRVHTRSDTEDKASDRSDSASYWLFSTTVTLLRSRRLC